MEWGDISVGAALALAAVAALLSGAAVALAVLKQQSVRVEALARLLEWGRSLERQRALLFELAHLHTGAKPLVSLLPEVTARLGAELGLARLAIFLVDGDSLVLQAFYGSGQAQPPASTRYRMLNDPFGGLALGRASHFCDEQSEAELPLPAFLRAGGFTATIPISRGEDALGLLVASKARGAEREVDPAPFLIAMADQVALSVHQEKMIAKLRELSTHDALTGLANRRLLGDRLEAEARSSERFGHDTALISIDIDLFKQLNDQRGHKAGDEALVKVAGLFRRAVRKVDLVARVGGEEFVVVLPRTGLKAAALVAEKLRARVSAAAIPSGDEARPLTVSVGVAVLGEDLDTDALLAQADKAMYAAKARGRDRVELAPPSPHLTLRSGAEPSTNEGSLRGHRPRDAG